MSVEGRYDDKISDMLLLLQEGLLRFLGQKPIDLEKFKFYFNKCFEQMKRIQEHFHQLSTKFTETLSKLKQFCQTTDKTTTIQPKPRYSQYEHKVFTLSSRSGSVGKTSQLSRQLLSIKQQPQDSAFYKTNKRQRVQTATNRAKVLDTSDFINVRPMTGRRDQRLNHRLLNQSKTISHDTVRSFRQSTDQNLKKSSKSSKKKMALNIDQQPALSSPEVQRRKKLLYESLSKQKIQSQDSGVFADSKVLSLFKKRIKNQNRWNRQIAQLI